jgi:hypothetical protein
MIVEQNANKFNGNSIAFAFIVSCVVFVGMFGLLLLVQVLFPLAVFGFVDWVIFMPCFAFVVSLIGHFLYFYFDWHFRNTCAICNRYDYGLVQIYAKDRCESVFVCKEHLR